MIEGTSQGPGLLSLYHSLGPVAAKLGLLPTPEDFLVVHRAVLDAVVELDLLLLGEVLELLGEVGELVAVAEAEVLLEHLDRELLLVGHYLLFLLWLEYQ